MKNNFFLLFFSITKFSKIILINLLNKKMYPTIFIPTPKNFKIS